MIKCNDVELSIGRHEEFHEAYLACMEDLHVRYGPHYSLMMYDALAPFQDIWHHKSCWSYQIEDGYFIVCIGDVEYQIYVHCNVVVMWISYEGSRAVETFSIDEDVYDYLGIKLEYE